MLIIFDLDDTLIDTSGCLSSLKLLDALRKMIAAGLSIPSEEEAFELLLKIDQTSLSAQETLESLLKQLCGDISLLEIGLKEYYENIQENAPIKPLEGVIDVLNELKKHHELAIVSIGIPHQQHSKILRAGIDSNLFKKIVVVEGEDKKPFYAQLAKEGGYLPEEVIVCGNHFEGDLLPAKELGFKTVHMRWGRGVKRILPGEVDYSISRLEELKARMN